MESKGLITRSVLVPPSKPTPYDVLPLTHGSVMAGLNTLISSHVLVFPPNVESTPVGGDGRGLVDVIQAGLGEVLVPYYPLAGRIVENETGWEVQCDGRGAVFVVTKMPNIVEPYNYPDTVSIQHFEQQSTVPISIEIEKDILVPHKERNEVVVVTPQPPPPPMLERHHGPMPALVVQITDLGHGGFVLGIRMCNRVCDTSGFVHFLSGWAEMARGKPNVTVAPLWPHTHTMMPRVQHHLYTSDENYGRGNHNYETNVRTPPTITNGHGFDDDNIQVHSPVIGPMGRHQHVQTHPYTNEEPHEGVHHHYTKDDSFGKARHLYTNEDSTGKTHHPYANDDSFEKTNHMYADNDVFGKVRHSYTDDDAFTQTHHPANDVTYERASPPIRVNGFDNNVQVHFPSLVPTTENRMDQLDAQRHVDHTKQLLPNVDNLDERATIVVMPPYIGDTIGTTQNILRLDVPILLVMSLFNRLNVGEGIKCSATHVIAAHIWRERTRALRLPIDAEARLFFVCDVDKKSPMGYYGAFKFNCVAKASVAHLLEMPLAWVVERLKEAEWELTTGKFEECIEEFKRVHREAEVLLLTDLPSSHEFDQQIDFGAPTGKPQSSQDLLQFPPQINIAAVAHPTSPNPSFLHIFITNVPSVHAHDLRSFICGPPFPIDTPSRM